ncbi:MAG: T9SS type A sorting domain-containing protein [Cyclobacteriaceae bacterium]|nr:T9SS type A sorting domain-containing protein [Cyclobacteriaceae bacterium SS2]
MKKIIVLSALCMLIGQLSAQTYVNKAITTIGSGVLEGGSYKSIVSLGEPSGKDNMNEDPVYSLSPGFIYVAEEPLKEVLGLKMELKEYTVYPNPTQNELHFRYLVDKPLKDLTIRVIDMDGKSLIEQTIPSEMGKHEVMIDVNHLQKSMYILMMESSTAAFKMNVRFVKQ